MPEPNFSKPRENAEPKFMKSMTTGRRGAEHEKRISKRTGEKRVSGSGSKPGRPGDLRGQSYLTEAKTTRGAGRMISGEEIAKISKLAFSVNLIPKMEICFEGQVLPVPKDWVLVPAEHFDELVRQAGGWKTDG